MKKFLLILVVMLTGCSNAENHDIKITEYKEDITNNAVLFYSPNAQAKLHEQNPSKYKNPPGFVNDQVEEVHISGTENDDIRFYKYKD